MSQDQRSAFLFSRRYRGHFLVSVAFVVLFGIVRADPLSAAVAIDYNRDIRPILSDNCYACHGPDKEKRKGGLRLDMMEDARKKLDSGATAIIPGAADQSRLLQVIGLPLEHEDRMPPAKTGKSLTASQRELLARWVAEGAKWTAHWSYVPPVRPALPEVVKKDWPRNEIDRFVLDALEHQKWEPNGEADRYTLARRASLDLTGLPPTVAEVDEFLADHSPEAYEKLVDRLMASPHLGERMALAWLDLARYADTAGYHFDGFRQMHMWRDWVIQAYNDNMPFDQFTIEQLAGDLLPNATVAQKTASGFHRNVMTNDEGGADPEEYLAKYMVDRVSTTAQVWLGTTVGCAECHDHKYDPISTREFYQLYAFFHNVPEKGLDGTRVRNPSPVLKVPSIDQGAQLVRYLELIPRAEKTYADREAELPKIQQQWESELQKQELVAPEPGGLLAHFPLDDSVGAGPGTNALATGSADDEDQKVEDTRWVEGKIGRALQFKGTNQFVNAGALVQLEHTNAFSYGGWVKLGKDTGAILSKMEAGPGFRGFDVLVAKGKIEAHLVAEFPGNAIKVSTRSTIPTNVWTHVFVSYDGSQKAAGLKIYVNGEAQAVDAPNDKLSGSILSSAPLLIGSRLGAFPFRGRLDDIRIYDRALRAEEISALASHPQLLIAKVVLEERTPEQKTDLRDFFRERHALDFLAARRKLDQLKKDKDELFSQIPDTMVMEEMEKPRDTFILMRGNFQQRGEKVTAGVPACWPAMPEDQPANRLGLARWLMATNNPLTARVTVNRLWGMFFGTGLVKTANDFGSQGERPSHPELLDWLACEFMTPQAQTLSGRSDSRRRNAWDLQHIVRLIVTSATYRQSAAITHEKLEGDPYNRLLTRGPRVRLEAELIRDNALAISGILNPKIGGPSIKPYQPPGIWDGTDHKYEQSAGPDLYRRGLYVFWKRAAHYPSFATFDAPSRETCTVSRPRTSTPLQSLVLMNDPVYVEAARALAARVLHATGSDLRAQLTHAFRLALARPPSDHELQVLEKTYRQQREHFAENPKAAEELLAVGESKSPKDLDVVTLAAMTGVANVLLNLNETITK